MRTGIVRTTSIIGFAAAAVVSSGCPNTRDGPARNAAADGGRIETTGGFDSVSIPEKKTPVSEGVMDMKLMSIYFDFDRSDIRTDARDTLRRNADAMRENVQWNRITVEGHTDERGSDEYNLALGERRAASAARYLTDLGVSQGQIGTVSFGESSPAVPGHEESAWQWNRRVQFRVAR